MNIDDRVFLDVCKLFDNNKINYWICHGTLLGIIREGRLLPWDHDIDFAVWDNETEKSKIISILESSGYQQEDIFGDMDCLHFKGENKKIDVSFYKIDDRTSSIKWAIAPKNWLNKLIVFVASRLYLKREDSEKNFSKYSVKNLILFFAEVGSSLMRRYLAKNIKNRIIQSALNKMIYIGYSYPTDMLKMKKIEYKGSLIPVPIDSEGCLRETYGKDWEIPKEEYVWFEEAKNLVEL
jgi:phosphorylcholine metabolism protein LicD